MNAMYWYGIITTSYSLHNVEFDQSTRGIVEILATGDGRGTLYENVAIGK